MYFLRHNSKCVIFVGISWGTVHARVTKLFEVCRQNYFWTQWLIFKVIGAESIFNIFFRNRGFHFTKKYLNFWVFIDDLRKFPVASKVQSSNTTDVLCYYVKLFLTCRHACLKRSFRKFSINLTFNMNQQEILFSINSFQ